MIKSMNQDAEKLIKNAEDTKKSGADNQTKKKQQAATIILALFVIVTSAWMLFVELESACVYNTTSNDFYIGPVHNGDEVEQWFVGPAEAFDRVVLIASPKKGGVVDGDIQVSIVDTLSGKEVAVAERTLSDWIEYRRNEIIFPQTIQLTEGETYILKITTDVPVEDELVIWCSSKTKEETLTVNGQWVSGILRFYFMDSDRNVVKSDSLPNIN